MSAAAFFDLDNTLVRGSSMFFLARRLVAERIVSRRQLAAFAWMELRFVLLRKESGAHRDRITESALALVRGRRTDEVEALCKQIARALVRERLVGATLRQLRAHQRAGQETWLVTASPIEIARVVARELGMTGALATVPRAVDGVYTGELDGPPMHGPRKAQSLQRLAEVRGLDLQAVAAYSDSENDVPMLSLAGSAAVVNANPTLLEVARERGWRVLVAPRTATAARVRRVAVRVLRRDSAPDWFEAAMHEVHRSRHAVLEPSLRDLLGTV